MQVLCDKCHLPVPPHNDATLFDALIQSRILLGEYTDVYQSGTVGRHLTPTLTCEGSPSRAQYLEGQPKDTRGYDYLKKGEKHMRQTYSELLRQYPPPKAFVPNAFQKKFDRAILDALIHLRKTGNKRRRLPKPFDAFTVGFLKYSTEFSEPVNEVIGKPLNTTALLMYK